MSCGILALCTVAHTIYTITHLVVIFHDEIKVLLSSIVTVIWAKFFFFEKKVHCTTQNTHYKKTKTIIRNTLGHYPFSYIYTQYTTHTWRYNDYGGSNETKPLRKALWEGFTKYSSSHYVILSKITTILPYELNKRIVCGLRNFGNLNTYVSRYVPLVLIDFIPSLIII